ncbi:twin-arginine translocase subunit TatC [Legionella israelensis]|uniref:twin-arginine translocase subunit TatC n=1 Tax=Legionella israelensis TaxID=454 RepID=UPI00117C226B|nr:twin-arginine translocase subunit TatC [Legionella israelensis]QDP71200.1 twin-arginine translocase subunit TatC [Legionella israelensis]
MLQHLIELRRRALQVFLCFIILFIFFFFWASDLFYLLVKPLLHSLPKSSRLIATQITAPILTPIHLSFNAALFFSAPITLYQIWRFSAPGLYPSERRYLRISILLSLLLFIVGVLFCYCIVLPFMFHFFAGALPKGVQLLPDMSYALDFITHMLILFGLSFQLPLLCLTLIQSGLLQLQQLKTFRPYVIVACFTLGMLLTPPDVLSQIMLAAPLCALYEFGILLAMFLPKSRKVKIIETQ